MKVKKIIIDINSLINNKQKKTLVYLFFLFLINMLLETLGVALVVPLLSAIITGDFVHNYLGEISFITNFEKDNIIFVFSLLLIFVYFLKTIFTSFYVWFQNNYIYKLQADLSKRMFSNYIHLPYIFHLQRNSSELVRNIIGEVNKFGSFLLSILTLAAEILVAAGVFSLLMLYEPYGTISITTIFVTFGILMHWGVSKRLTNWGIDRQKLDGIKIQNVNEGMGGIKDVKIFGKEGSIISKFNKFNIDSNNINRNFSFTKQLPRLLYELLAVISIIVLVLILVYMDKNSNHIITTLALFSAAVFKLLPSINRIMNSIQNIRFNKPILKVLVTEFQNADKFITKQSDSCESSMLFDKNIKLDKVSFSYKGDSNYALSKIDLTIKKGDSIGVIGPSGEGKSTLVNIILGLLECTSGRVLVDGVDIKTNFALWQKKIGYIPQHIYLTDDTIRRNIAFGEYDDEINEKNILTSISEAQLDELISTLPNGLDTIVGEHGVRLSGGQRQRIGIARALYNNPSVVVLDEATSALDINTEDRVMDAIYKINKDKTMIIVSHRYNALKGCNYVYNLSTKNIEKNIK